MVEVYVKAVLPRLTFAYEKDTNSLIKQSAVGIGRSRLANKRLTSSSSFPPLLWFFSGLSAVSWVKYKDIPLVPNGGFFRPTVWLTGPNA